VPALPSCCSWIACRCRDPGSKSCCRPLRRAFANLREGLDPVAALSARFITREQRARRCLTALYALRRRDGSLESLLLALQPVGPPAGVMLARPALLSAV
jgi:hypothetical protein